MFVHVHTHTHLGYLNIKYIRLGWIFKQKKLKDEYSASPRLYEQYDPRHFMLLLHQTVFGDY